MAVHGLMQCASARLGVFFFFSSRRRHTRCSRDWSSDVCSSDLADTKRVAVMGWSIGGIVSVLAASRSSAFRKVVDQAGGALTWDQSHAMQQALKEAAAKIRIPLQGMVAKNDRTTESVKTVVHEAEEHGATAKLIEIGRAHV